MNKQNEKLKVKGEKYKICATDFEGITLVALVITIIVLIILAAVSINAVMNDGLIKNAKGAAGTYKQKSEKEQLKLTSLEGMLEVTRLKEVKAGEYTGTENKRYVQGGQIAVIPAGFTVSNITGENTISGGLVIYSGNQEGKDMSNLRTSINQYVWIPVENPSDMYGILSSEVEGIDGIKYGKLYFKTYTEEDTHYNWPSEENYSPTSYREPAIISDEISALNLNEEFSSMIASVEKYKGFYIGRYELSGSTTAPTIIKEQVPLNYTTWIDFYSACKTYLESGNTHAQGKIDTTIIWGCQWDQAVKKCLDVDNSYLTTNSHLYGVYGTNSLKYTGSKQAIFNIYDMGGNVWDFLIEGKSDGFAVVGGYAGNKSAMTFPASRRASSGELEGDQIVGCRAQLYVK